MWINRKTERQKDRKRGKGNAFRQKVRRTKRGKRHMEIDKEVKADKETE